MIWKTVLAGMLLYGGLVAILALLQTGMLFPRKMVGPAPALPPQTIRLQVTTPEGDTLHGVQLPGADPQAPLLLGFGGNAWNAEGMALFLRALAPGHPVAAFHYRGYAPSTGRPSAAALLADAILVHDTLDAAHGVIAVGFSIGTGPAAHLAGQRDLRGVVLVTPFDRLRDVAAQAFPFAPVRWLFRHDMHPLADLTGNLAPTAILIATQDEVIPSARAEALVTGLAAANRAALAVHRIAARHNSIYDHPDFAPALRDAVAGAR
jgi:dienelactone hydrolase